MHEFDDIEKPDTGPISDGEKLVGADKCLAILFPDPDSRPSSKTLRAWAEDRVVPSNKIGGRIYFRPARVSAALDRYERKARSA